MVLVYIYYVRHLAFLLFLQSLKRVTSGFYSLVSAKRHWHDIRFDLITFHSCGG